MITVPLFLHLVKRFFTKANNRVTRRSGRGSGRLRLEIRLSAKREKLFFETALPLIDTGGRRDHSFFVLFTGFLSYCSVNSNRCATRGGGVSKRLRLERGDPVLSGYLREF